VHLIAIGDINDALVKSIGDLGSFQQRADEVIE